MCPGFAAEFTAKITAEFTTEMTTEITAEFTSEFTTENSETVRYKNKSRMTHTFIICGTLP